MKIAGFSGVVVSLVLAACGGTTDGEGLLTGPPQSCVNLSLCCAHMTGAPQATCNSVAQGGLDSLCSEELGSDTAAGDCSGVIVPPGQSSSCSDLGACCAQMSPPLQAECEAVVNEAVATMCASDLTTYTDANACKSTIVVPTDGGIPPIDGSVGDGDHGDTGLPPQFDSGCGECTSQCVDGCGAPCTGGACGRTCVAFCVTDEDCSNSCPTVHGGESCCDQTSGVCFSSSDSCPVAQGGVDGGSMY